MGYQALLFCPDEKTARTVTQVLSELDFQVEACIEPFNAVKKLMAQHFDAVVVDCDNEQNATLLFKSARNSSSNQTSLAVAVVEGQAGVAKAFRIGANLVLTKPINIEQTKGTLRVARGLLRKSEPTKPATGTATTPPASAAAAPADTPVSKPILTAKAETPVAPPIVKPAPMPAWPTTAGKPARTASDDDVLEIGAEDTVAKTTAGAPAVGHTASTASQDKSGGGAASAPARARDSKVVEIPHTSAIDEEDILSDKPDAAHTESPAAPEAAPSFTFGGANELTESTGGSKKILIGVAAAAIVAAGLYIGWSKFQRHAPEPASSSETPAAQAPAAVSPAPAVIPSSTPPAPKKPTAALSNSEPASSAGKINVDHANESSFDEDSLARSSKATSTPTKPSEEPLVVKGGKAPSAHSKAAAADAPAPSVIGIADASAGSALPPDLSSSASTATPVLEALNVSQGVSQGLLIKKVQPVYPKSAMQMRIEGTVDLMATVSKTGDITHVKVLSGDAQLTHAATDAVKQWKYKPYLLNGEPVEIQTQITINFKLPH